MAEQWRFKRPDWKSGKTYAYIDGLTSKQMAWEYLRRSPLYRRYYFASLNTAADDVRQEALQLLKLGSPLTWYVPKKGFGKFYKLRKTLDDFVRRVKADSPRNPRKMLRLRRIDPSMFGLTRFNDPNETPLKDEAIFETAFIDSITAREVGMDVDFLNLDEFEVALKVDIRYSADEASLAVKSCLTEYRRARQIETKKAVGIHDRIADRTVLLQAIDAYQAHATTDERNPILFPEGAYKGRDHKNTYNKNVRSAKALMKKRYRYLALLPPKRISKKSGD